jgi:hypothetical protein
VRRTNVVCLGARQEDGHAAPRFDGDVLDLQPAQFVRSETPPEADQHQRLVTGVDLELTARICHRSCGDLGIEPRDQSLQLHELQRFGAPLLGRVQCLDALEHLPHVWRPGRVGETL